jgi:hypothetical protein
MAITLHDQYASALLREIPDNGPPSKIATAHDLSI